MKTNFSLGLFLVVAVVGIGACREYSTRPLNRGPTISSVVAFPSVLGQGDSAIVTVFATDPDGDSLTYEWRTDSRLKIKGDVLEDGWLNNTVSSSHVFYRSTSPAYDDTAGVRCTVWDRRGAWDARTVLILLRN